ncbi:MAG: hypothetical protein HYR73_02435 [Candidatus Eisenbacteria bacterium]|nr:hypothetical protein [Candidatus Eisenbacteria bacterium]
MKRTTLILDAALHGELKRQAHSEGCTLTERIERALRLGLAAETGGRRSRVILPSYDLGPYLIDPHDRASWDGGAAYRGPRE